MMGLGEQYRPPFPELPHNYFGEKTSRRLTASVPHRGRSRVPQITKARKLVVSAGFLGVCYACLATHCALRAGARHLPRA